MKKKKDKVLSDLNEAVVGSPKKKCKVAMMSEKMYMRLKSNKV